MDPILGLIDPIIDCSTRPKLKPATISVEDLNFVRVDHVGLNALAEDAENLAHEQSPYAHILSDLPLERHEL
jgi:hypothetical protein